jgi:hypothetical protein
MKKVILIITLLAGIAGFIKAQNINGRISSSVYTFQRYDSANNSDTYARNYEMMNLNMNYGQFSLRTLINFETDLFQTVDNDPRVRFYNLFFEARDLFDIATVKLGRQPLISSAIGGVFDGAAVNLKYSDYRGNFFYGGNTPAYQKLELTKNWKDDRVMGGKVSALLLENFNLGVSFIDKNFKSDSYITQRIDQNLDPVQALIEKKSNQYKFGTAELSYENDEKLAVNTRYDFDFNYEKTSKFELAADINYLPDLGFNLYYNYREPLISYNSIFSVFNYGNTQEIEAGANYKLNKLFTLSGRFANVKFTDENSQRITLGLISKYGSLSYRKNLGDAGEMDAVSVYSAYTLPGGVFTPSLGLSYTNYKLSKDDESNNLTSLLAGVNICPFKTLSFDLQTQYSNNRIYKNDVRFLLKLNYWFNQNFN